MGVTVLAVLAALHVVTCLSLGQFTDMPRVSLSTTSTWTKANTSCRLYQPEIYLNDSGAFIDINSSIINRTQPWVGYVRAFTTFDYKGCWTYASMIRDTNRTFNASSIDMCFSYCLLHNITLLAVQKVYTAGILTCYCLNSIEWGAATWPGHCSKVCSGLPCGRRSSTSVYQLATLQTDGIDGTVCLAIAKSNKYTWKQCDNTTVSGIVCKRMISSGETFTFVNISVSNWLRLMNFCKASFMETVEATDINALSLSAKELYGTDTFGTMVIRRGTDMNLRYPVTFGYYNEGKIGFKGVTEDTNALCETFPTTASIPTTETNGLWLGLYVGLAFGVCVAVIVIFLKCRHYSTATGKYIVQTLVVANTANDAPLPQEQTIENIGTLNAGNNCFVLEKTKYCAALPNAKTCNASHQMAESVYDVCGERERALHQNPTENVYNTIRSFTLQESVYNRTSTSFAGSEAFRTSTNPVTEIVEHVYGPNSATGQKGYFETENVYNVPNHKYDRGGEYDQPNTFFSTENGLPKIERSDHFSTNTVHDTEGIYSNIDDAYELIGEINQNRAIYHAEINTADNQNSPTGSKTSIGEDEQYAVCGEITLYNDAIDDNTYNCLG